MLDPARRWGRFGKPDYAGLLSYAGMPWTEEVAHLEGVDVAIVGAPMDDLVSDRPGARFGPRGIRGASLQAGPSVEVGIDPLSA
jgi:arginase family enzyme